MSHPTSQPTSAPSDNELTKDEIFWRDHQGWLRECGYMLRPRYMPDWQPSWKQNPKLFRQGCEDGQAPLLPYLIFDATRISDGTQVIFKVVDSVKHPYEQEIMSFFSTDTIASDPKNHCAPLYETLKVPDVENKIILVMPLFRRRNDPPFVSVGEVVDFVGQVIEGVEYMHDHNVAHRDCMKANIMMDGAIYPDGFHPVDKNMKKDWSGEARHYTRTERRPKYYLIDFGMSRRYRSEEMPPLEDPMIGGDKTVPEFQNATGYLNPFPTDVYYIGNMVREDFLKTSRSFEFMEPLIQDMVQDDPSKRPTMKEVVERFSKIRLSLSAYKLRSRVVSRKENVVAGLFRDAANMFRSAKYTLKGVPADPAR